jgi:nucleoside 2-deoxyribosyltransferase
MKKYKIYIAGAMEMVRKGDHGAGWRRELEQLVKADPILSERISFVHPEIPETKEGDKDWRASIEEAQKQRDLFVKGLGDRFAIHTSSLIWNVIETDIDLLLSCDAVLVCYGAEANASTGTVSEMSVAFANKKPYYVFCKTDLASDIDSRCNNVKTWTASALINANNFEWGYGNVTRKFLVDMIHNLDEINEF